MADQRIQYSDRMTGAGHPARPDTLNKLTLVEHNIDGTHKIDKVVTSVNTRQGVVTLDASDVGLGNCDNTSDANKPMSTATSTAIGVVNSALGAHTSDTSNPHSVTAFDVGLGNVDNTSDLNKPVSTATQSALDGKSATTHNHDSSYAATSHNHDATYAPVAKGVTNGNSHDHIGGDGAAISLTSAVTGILPVANGGTGSNTQNFVDLTSNQTIGGVKTFSNNMEVNGAIYSSGIISGAHLRVTNTNGITLSDNAVGGFLSYGYNSGRTNAADHVWYNGISSELMRLTSSGNLLIGTTADVATNIRGLFYASGAALPATTGTSQTAGLRVGNNNHNAVLDIGQGTSSEGYGTWLQATNIGNLGFYYPMLLNPRGGNLLIGTTTDDGVNKLQVSGSAKISSELTVASTGYPTAYLTSLFSSAGAVGILTLGNNGVNEFRAGRENIGGYFNFYVNNTVAPTAASDGLLAMRLSNTGNLLIGTTTDDGVNKLQVSGGVKFSGNLSLSTGQSLLMGTTQANGFINIQAPNANDEHAAISIYNYVGGERIRFTYIQSTASLKIGVGTTPSNGVIDISSTGLSVRGSVQWNGNTIPTLANNEISLIRTGDTNVRIYLKGSDGVLRSADITVA